MDGDGSKGLDWLEFRDYFLGLSARKAKAGPAAARGTAIEAGQAALEGGAATSTAAAPVASSPSQSPQAAADALCGEWQLASVENFDEFLLVMGVPWPIRKLIKKMNYGVGKNRISISIGASASGVSGSGGAGGETGGGAAGGGAGGAGATITLSLSETGPDGKLTVNAVPMDGRPHAHVSPRGDALTVVGNWEPHKEPASVVGGFQMRTDSEDADSAGKAKGKQKPPVGKIQYVLAQGGGGAGGGTAGVGATLVQQLSSPAKDGTLVVARKIFTRVA
jgi:hypothetical protein